MSDAELICGFMEPKPSMPEDEGAWERAFMGSMIGCWWVLTTTGYDAGDDVVILPRTLDLDALHEVEAKIIQRGLADTYRTELVKADAYFWHATAEQKCAALAAVLREGEKTE